MKENVTILSIDDDPQICFALGELFKFQGWRAVSANDVSSGLEAFRRYLPDIVLIDYHMPGMSGIEGVKLLRKQSPSVPIIVFTIDESQSAGYRQPDQAASAYVGAAAVGAAVFQGNQWRHVGAYHRFSCRAGGLCDGE